MKVANNYANITCFLLMIALFFIIIDIFRYRNVRYNVSIKPIIPVFDIYCAPILTPNVHGHSVQNVLMR